ncbi:hypothetical protein [Pedobacter glucosidilyticus]|uniref:hypothetical protein n=1 Tax=Pedobacter glucosidilyticus TaxID=1122941 RepID=UPI0026EB7E85|nr:hypothetical protein [Pedobacter glucosidilyticus]
MNVPDLEKFIPSLDLISHLGLYLLAYVALAVLLVSVLKAKFKIKTAYSRKIYHFLIFTAAAVLQVLYGLPAAVLMGLIVSLWVIFAVLKGQNSFFYLALAREKDEPHANKFILIPLFATAIGGVLSNLFFPGFAFLGYLVGGWGDAIGEPVGSKWGKHPYQVPTLFGVKATRTYEGSLAIFIISALICFLIYRFYGYQLQSAIVYAMVCAFVATLVEAFSSHGLDNLTMQLSAAAASYYLLT